MNIVLDFPTHKENYSIEENMNNKVTIGGNTIDTATKDELESVKLQIEKQLAKPKQYVFKEGDFALQDERIGFIAPSAKDEHKEWRKSFAFLSYHCLKLGGRVMSKPNDGRWWYMNAYDYFTSTFKTEESINLIWEPFAFPSKDLAEQFLEIDGVESHLLNFFQIER